MDWRQSVAVLMSDGASLHTLSTKYMLKRCVPHKTIKTIMIANVMNGASSEMDGFRTQANSTAGNSAEKAARGECVVCYYKPVNESVLYKP